MARGNATADTAAKTNANEASGVFGSLNPFLTSQMINPPGFGPEAKAKMNTAAMQGAGGATAGAVGQGSLRAARTRNKGGTDAATAASTRAAADTLSHERLGVEGRDAQLKAAQQSGAASGLEGIFGHSTAAVPNDVNANTNAANASWDWAKDLFVPLTTGAMSAGAKAYAG